MQKPLFLSKSEYEDIYRHLELSRSLIDRMFGLRKDIDKIVEVRRQIREMEKLFDSSGLNRYRNSPNFGKPGILSFLPSFYKKYTDLDKDVSQQMLILGQNSIMNEVYLYDKYGGDVVLKKLTEVRDRMIDILTDVIDISDIQRDIRDNKINELLDGNVGETFTLS